MISYSLIKQLQERGIKVDILYKLKSTGSLKADYYVNLMNEFMKFRDVFVATLNAK